uniref:Esa1-associated factor 6 homolog n=1 Tax=Panagrellus redivivus TaxID=6233 RepID=A0A7E4UXL3_PANRE
MSDRIRPCRRQRDGRPGVTVEPVYNLEKARRVVQDAFETKKKLDYEMFNLETGFLEDASRISNTAKDIKNNRANNAFDFNPEQHKRRVNVSIKPHDRLFSRCTFSSSVYAPGQPFHKELVHAVNSNVDPGSSLNRPDTPDDYNNMMDYATGGTSRQTRPSEYEQTDDDDDYHDGDSMMDDTGSVGTAQDDMDGSRYDVDMVDDYNEDSNSGVYNTGTSSRRNSNRMRMSSGSISPGLLTSRKRMSNIDLDYTLRSKKSKRRR